MAVPRARDSFWEDAETFGLRPMTRRTEPKDARAAYCAPNLVRLYPRLSLNLDENQI